MQRRSKTCLAVRSLLPWASFRFQETHPPGVLRVCCHPICSGRQSSPFGACGHQPGSHRQDDDQHRSFIICPPLSTAVLALIFWIFVGIRCSFSSSTSASNFAFSQNNRFPLVGMVRRNIHKSWRIEVTTSRAVPVSRKGRRNSS